MITLPPEAQRFVCSSAVQMMFLDSLEVLDDLMEYTTYDLEKRLELDSFNAAKFRWLLDFTAEKVDYTKFYVVQFGLAQAACTELTLQNFLPKVEWEYWNSLQVSGWVGWTPMDMRGFIKGLTAIARRYSDVRKSNPSVGGGVIL